MSSFFDFDKEVVQMNHATQTIMLNDGLYVRNMVQNSRLSKSTHVVA